MDSRSSSVPAARASPMSSSAFTPSNKPGPGSKRSRPPSSSSSVLLPRLVLATLLCISLFLPSLLQPALTALYTYLYHSPFYRFSGFETIETIVCYATIEILFTYKFGKSPDRRIDIRGPHTRKVSSSGSTDTTVDENDEKPPKIKVPKMRRPSKRMGEMFIYAAPLLLMDFTMIKKFAGVSVDEIRVSGGYSPLTAYAHIHHPGAGAEQSTLNQYLNNHNASTSTLFLLTSTIGNEEEKPISPSFLLPTLHNFTLSSPIQLTRALPPPHPTPPTPRRLTLELLASLLIYDTLFFLLHLALHRLPLLSTFHLPHHAHTEMHPQITNRLTIAERLSLVLLANFSLNVIGSHVLTRTFFVPIFVYLLVEVHSGLDLEWGYEKILPRGWGSGAKVHARHHRSGVGGLAPFFGWWDWVLEKGWKGRAGRRVEDEQRGTERWKGL